MKTLIDIDDDLLAAAATELGTTTKKDTVNEALRFIAGRPERARRLLRPLADGESPLARLGLGEDITNPEIMKLARR